MLFIECMVYPMHCSDMHIVALLVTYILAVIKYLTKIDLRGKRFVTYSSRVQAIMVRKSWWQAPDAAGYIAFTVGKQKVAGTSAHLPFNSLGTAA